MAHRYSFRASSPDEHRRLQIPPTRSISSTPSPQGCRIDLQLLGIHQEGIHLQPSLGEKAGIEMEPVKAAGDDLQGGPGRNLHLNEFGAGIAVSERLVRCDWPLKRARRSDWAARTPHRQQGQCPVRPALVQRTHPPALRPSWSLSASPQTLS